MRPASSFISQPVRSLQTMLRVLAKDDGSNPNVVPDGIYGPETMYAVSAFQRKHGIPQTGITDQVTWDSIVNEYEEAIIRVDKAQSIEILMRPGEEYTVGHTGSYVYLLQAMLADLSNSYSSVTEPNITGTFDQETAASISEFQTLAGLPSTGVLDRKTWKHLVLHFTLNTHQVQGGQL